MRENNLRITGAIILTILSAGYFLPTSIALWRDAEKFEPIAATNLFFGWTLLGWIIALVWAISNERKA